MSELKEYMTDKETVSIVMATYNGAKYIRQQMASILAQTYPLYEIIIQDDGSTDGTIEIIKEYSERYANVHFYMNEAEHGVNGNFYSAIRRATGKYIAICDQDDIWHHEKIEKQMAVIGDKLLCSCRSKPFSEENAHVYYDERMPNMTLLRMLNSAEIPGHTMLLNREFLDRIPDNCDVEKIGIYDVVFSVTAAAYNSIAFVDEILVRHRSHQASATYCDYSDSSPCLYNGLRMLVTCVVNYKRIKKLAAPRYKLYETYLSCLKGEPQASEGIRMMRLMQSTSFTDYVKFTVFCVHHKNEICHTPGKFPKDIIRALLFPVTSVWYKRYLLK